jgi:hypothetical protein
MIGATRLMPFPDDVNERYPAYFSVNMWRTGHTVTSGGGTFRR